jgi:hypothetical protein
VPAQHGPSAVTSQRLSQSCFWPGSAIVNIEKVALVVSLEDAIWGGVERTMTSNVFWCWKRRL